MVQDLIAGFQTFRESSYGNEDALMERLTREGQSPNYCIISCIDSRSNPGKIFKADSGTFFAFQAMGAVIRPYKTGTALAATLQFAIEHMNVPEVIVLGHTQCGAIKALFDNTDDPEIASFVDVAQSAMDDARASLSTDVEEDVILRLAEQKVVLQSIENLKKYPAVERALAASKVHIRGWMFNMMRGEISEYNPETKIFEPLHHSASADNADKTCACS